MPAGSDVIHLEADIHATEGNANGFAKDEFVPYLKIRYAITPADGGAVIHQGPLMPMIARDGLHYGASLAMPKAGVYRLIFSIEPPSMGGLGRHSDPITGVAPWWEPFELAFDWDYPGPPRDARTVPASTRNQVLRCTVWKKETGRSATKRRPENCLQTFEVLDEVGSATEL